MRRRFPTVALCIGLTCIRALTAEGAAGFLAGGFVQSSAISSSPKQPQQYYQTQAPAGGNGIVWG